MTVVQDFLNKPYGEGQSFRPKIVDRTSGMGENVWNLQYSPLIDLIYKIFLAQLRQEMSCKAK